MASNLYYCLGLAMGATCMGIACGDAAAGAKFGTVFAILCFGAMSIVDLLKKEKR